MTITNVETGLTRTIATDARGWYRAAALPPGRYQLSAELGGFCTETRAGLTLTVGQIATIDLVLTLAALAESVSVNAAAPLVDATDHAIRTTVTRTQLDTLPLATRDFASLAQTAPGIFSSPDLARPVGAGSFTSGGQLSRNNSLLIDGLSNDNVTNATTRGGFSLETVREFVVFAPRRTSRRRRRANSVLA